MARRYTGHEREAAEETGRDLPPGGRGEAADRGEHGRGGTGSTAEHAVDPERGRPPEGPRGEEPPESPTDLSGRSWKNVFKRTAKEFKEDGLIDWAASLTYYGVLSIFPALLALISIAGLMGTNAIQTMIENLGELTPGPVRDLLTSMLGQLEGATGGAGFALIAGLAVALWSASAYIAAFMRASNAVYDIGEGRPIWKTLPIRFGVTVVVAVVLVLIAVGVVFTGTLADRAGEVLGLGDTAVRVWDIAKWPVMVLLFSMVIALLYWACPNVKHGFRWVSPGSLLAVLIWILASVGFAIYVANFGNYNQTYGSLAGVIIFLIWMWISNIAILLGLEVNAELERSRAIATGHSPETEPYVEPRDTRKL
ncbi:YihY/virulence factor BrkB family protein [Streptomyces calidiresistens]|uniref:YihY family inner membrane protein n=1 Tax=Streptomyces calidiresistens TaxID=1485586 RepID=A0A7W3T5Z7_9ACTN|nr:YihY/virulence factor BrkB family protein [Streptomyces calidiresistens]MBB0231572.1 YihY family inner membrane protein [Streptomyces calidiresistens]